MPSCWIVDGAMPASARRKNFKSQRRRGIKVSDQLNFQPTMGPIFELGMTETPRTTHRRRKTAGIQSLCGLKILNPIHWVL
jgi:hypothetical protein